MKSSVSHRVAAVLQANAEMHIVVMRRPVGTGHGFTEQAGVYAGSTHGDSLRARPQTMVDYTDHEWDVIAT